MSYAINQLVFKYNGQKIDGVEIVALMRASKTTIRATAERGGVYMTQVREARERGIVDGMHSLDWFEMITGSLDGFWEWRARAIEATSVREREAALARREARRQARRAG